MLREERIRNYFSMFGGDVMAVHREEMRRMEEKRKWWLTLGIVTICVIVLAVVWYFRR